MKKLILGLTLLASMSSFASSIENYLCRYGEREVGNSKWNFTTFNFVQDPYNKDSYKGEIQNGSIDDTAVVWIFLKYNKIKYLAIKDDGYLQVSSPLPVADPMILDRQSAAQTKFNNGQNHLKIECYFRKD